MLSKYIINYSCGWNNKQIIILLIEFSKLIDKCYLQDNFFYILNLEKIYKYLIF